MKIMFLGTSSAQPTRTRNVTGIAFSTPDSREVWLFDCGDGSQRQVLANGLSISGIRRVFITHMHGDHVFGLPGLMATMSLSGKTTQTDLYGPEPLEAFLSGCRDITNTRFNFPYTIHRLEPGIVFQNNNLSVECLPLDHGVATFGFRICESQRPGRLHVDRLKALGVPEGPIYGRLKSGEEVLLPDGRTIKGRDYCDPPIRGRILTICLDTFPCENAVKLARDADLLIYEATYGEELRERALERKHSTAAMAADIAKQARVRRLFLTHFSTRYDQEAGVTTSNLLEQARMIFPATELAQDGLSVEIPSP